VTLIMRNGVIKSAENHAKDIEAEREALLKETRKAIGHLLEVIDTARLPTCLACEEARALYRRLSDAQQ